MAFNGQPPKTAMPNGGRWKVVLLVLLVLCLGSVVAYKITGSFNTLMRGNFAYTEGVKLMAHNGAAMAVLGKPIEVVDILSGGIKLRNLDGVARYAIRVEGSRCGGVLYIRAEKHGGIWDIYLLALQPDCADTPLVLRNTRNVMFLDTTAQET